MQRLTAARAWLRVLLIAASCTTTFFAPGTLAQEPGHEGLQFGAAWGSGSESSNALRLSVTKPWKRRWFEGGRAYLTGYWEASVARFENDVDHIPADDGTARLWNVAVAPVFRLQFTLGGPDALVQPFLDLGVGLSFHSDREFRTGNQRSRPLGSFFQFEDRGAAGIKFGRWEVAYQRMHYSNLSLASDNFGIDAHLLLIRRSNTLRN